MTGDVLNMVRSFYGSRFNVKSRERPIVTDVSDYLDKADKAAKTEKAKPSADTPATILELSDDARRTLALKQAGLEELEKMPKNFGELVDKKTTEFAKDAFGLFGNPKLMMETDPPLVMRLDSSGKLDVGDRYQKKLDDFFRDNPKAELEFKKKFKETAALNTLKAVSILDRLLEREKAAANTKEKKDAAWDRYLFRATAVMEVSKILVFKEGEVMSPAMHYAEGLLSPQQFKAYQEKGIDAI